MNPVKNGIAIAAAAAALFSSAFVAAGAQAADEAGIKCAGVNSCKGQSECKTASNECKGQNSCQGQGWVSRKTAAECTAAGGKVIEG